MPLTVNDQIEAIRALNLLDKARWAAEDELASTPKQLEEEQGAVGASIADRDRLATELTAAQARVRGGEREIDELERRQKRASDRMPNLTSSSQIEATEREVARLIEEREEIEMTTLEVMEEVDGLKGQLQAATELAESVGAVLTKRAGAWGARKVSLEQTVAEKAAAREIVVAPLSSELMRLYRAGVNASNVGRGKGGATTETDATCDTCWAEIPRRWINETIARKGLYSCQTCKRIIIADRVVKEPSAET